MTGLTRSVAEPRVRRRGFSPGAVVGLVVLAAIAGLLLGGFAGSGDPPAPRAANAPQPVVHDGLRLQVPRGWARSTVVGVPGFNRPLGLHHSDAGLRALVERLPATSATLLPAAFIDTLKHAPEPPQVVRLGAGQEAWRYRFAGGDGSMTLFYVAPTTGGIATVACTSPLEASIPRECAALAAAATVPGSRPLEPGTSAAFFSRLPSVVSDLGVSRSKGVAELRAATRARGQALAADGLARAHKAVGATLAPLTGARDGAPAATVGALTAAGTAYGALAGAARARSPRRYADARRTVTGAETDLNRAMTKVSAALSAATRGAELKASAPVRTPAAQQTPATTNPVKADPAAKTPSTTDPTTTNPAKADPAAKTPSTTDPTTTNPAKADPAAKTPSTTDPTTTNPAKADPAAKTPSTTDPTTTNPAKADPAAKTPSTTDPTTTNPAKADPAAKTPSTTDPATTSRPRVDPVTKTPSTTEAALKAPANARPAATAAGGADLTLILLALFGAVAVFLAIRGTRRALR